MQVSVLKTGAAKAQGWGMRRLVGLMELRDAIRDLSTFSCAVKDFGDPGMDLLTSWAGWAGMVQRGAGQCIVALLF
eukprot:353543-Chlamydomonas_euryale.AAC.6